MSHSHKQSLAACVQPHLSSLFSHVIQGISDRLCSESQPDSSLRRPLLKSLMYSCTLAYPVLTVCCFFSTSRGAGVTSSMPMEKPLLPMKRALSLAKRFMQLAATKAE